MKSVLLVVALFALLSVGCASTAPSPGPDIFFPEGFFGRESDEHMGIRFAENWEAVLTHPEVRESLHARLLVGPGEYRMIDGSELVRLSYERPVLVRHTRGGDFDYASGIWYPGCPGSFFQNKFEVYDYIQHLEPAVAIVEIHTQENSGCVPASGLLKRWAIETGQKLSPDQLPDFYKFWNILQYNRETKAWDKVADTQRERHRAIREASCEGWTWQVSPATPFVFRFENGHVVKQNGRYLLIFGTPPRLFERHPEERVILQTYTEEYFKADDRSEYSLRPLTPQQALAGEHIAEALLHELGF